MPIHERAVGILFPRPHMKGVERGESKTIWALEIVKELSHELWRLSRVSLVPVAGNNQKVGPDQLQVAVRHRFVDYNLGARGIYRAGSHERQVHKMQSHCSRVRSAHTTE